MDKLKSIVYTIANLQDEINEKQCLPNGFWKKTKN